MVKVAVAATGGVNVKSLISVPTANFAQEMKYAFPKRVKGTGIVQPVQ